jgi:tetratricopeptide (TPR) repeat protein
MGARAEQLAKKFDESCREFATVVEDNSRLLYRLAGTYAKLGQSTAAEQAAEKALALRPESLDEHLLIGHELEEAPELVVWAEPEYRQVLQSATPGSRQDFAV